jgi:hypothetical protein
VFVSLFLQGQEFWVVALVYLLPLSVRERYTSGRLQIGIANL